ncbi:hypothetical protein [Paenalcaligenes sp. Me131]|uniref:hypothetical protein n=1 Tax=Paenalcaligenes sp. Me131 TaxID=3392636 RepID=UPI003D2D33BB
MKRIISMLSVVALTSGCASITSESTQLVRVDALDESGQPVAEATCELINDKGTYNTEIGKHTMVNKSSNDLSITCSAPDREDKATGTAISRAGAGMFGNILFGGGIGAIIDHNRGTAYNYPAWIQVVFGKVFVFDRTHHKDGVPLQGEEVLVAEKTEAPITPKVNLVQTAEQEN